MEDNAFYGFMSHDSNRHNDTNSMQQRFMRWLYCTKRGLQISLSAFTSPFSVSLVSNNLKPVADVNYQNIVQNNVKYKIGRFIK